MPVSEEKRDIILARQLALRRLSVNPDFKTFALILHEDSCRALMAYDKCEPEKDLSKFYQIKAQRWFVDVNIPEIFNDYLNFENKKRKFSFMDWLKKPFTPAREKVGNK